MKIVKIEYQADPKLLLNYSLDYLRVMDGNEQAMINCMSLMEIITEEFKPELAKLWRENPQYENVGIRYDLQEAIFAASDEEILQIAVDRYGDDRQPVLDSCYSKVLSDLVN